MPGEQQGFGLTPFSQWLMLCKFLIYLESEGGMMPLGGSLKADKPPYLG
jgi:hypothetical protein